MAYLGIGYSGSDNFLKDFADSHSSWLKGDRTLLFFGNNFVILYDSNTAREFVKKVRISAPKNTIFVYPMDRPIIKYGDTV